MMRLLLILISLLGLNVNSLEYIEYTVKPGDTLSEIAEEFSSNLEDVYFANKALGFNPNKIEIGQKILVPFEYKQEICPVGISLHESIVITESSSGFFYQDYKDSYFSDLNELFSYCVDFDNFQTLMQADYNDAKELILSDKSYQQALMLYMQIVENRAYEEYRRPVNLYCDSLLSGIEDYLSLSYYTTSIFSCNFSYQEIENSKLREPIKNAMLFSLGYTNIEEGTSVNYWLLPTKFRFDFLVHLLVEMPNKNNEKFTELINAANKTFREYLAINPYSIDYSLIVNTANLGYLALNNDHELIGYSSYIELASFFCNECEVYEMRKLLADGMSYADPIDVKDEQWASVVDFYFIDRLIYPLYANFIGNFSHFVGDQEFEEDRELIIESLESDLSILKELDLTLPYVDVTEKNLSMFYSDLATGAAIYGKCDYAAEKLRAAFTYYKDDVIASDTFREPLQISNCYLRKNDFAKAKEFMELALETSQDKILLNTYFKSMAILANGFLNDGTSNYIVDAQNELLLTQNYQGTIDDFEIALEMLFLLEKNLNSGSIDFIKLKNKYNSISSSDKLTKARVFAGNQNLLKLQQDLIKTSKDINDLEINIFTENKADKDSLISLYEQKKNIIKSIYSQSEKMNSLYGDVFSNQDELMAKIPEDTKVLSYFIFDRSAWALIFSDSEVTFVDLETTSGSLSLKNKMLSESLGTNSKFDFSLSNELYNMIFKKIDKFFDQGSTIFIYDSDKVRLPLSVLVRSIPEKSNYEKSLVEADWLIRNYAFAYIYPSKTVPRSGEYNERFLGLANASSYSWAELPTLKSSIKEVQNLALSSNGKKENILINEDASKENFLKKIEKNYERIVIATHAVPEDWKGYTSESALILGSTRSDYFLTSSEIAQLNFESDMVVLSSCSGMSEDFKDLFKSFLVAGAQSIVHANWNLESRFAAEFTDRFFKELWLEKNIEKHEAMRNVALSFLDDYSNPIYADPAFWGNFSIGYSSL